MCVMSSLCGRSVVAALFAGVAGVVGVAGLAATGGAAEITFTHSGSGSGTLNGVPFGPSNFEIISVGNTDARISETWGHYVVHSTASINIQGVGTVTITSPTRTFVNTGIQLVGFSRTGESGADLFNGPMSPEFGSWDMTTSIGPVVGNANLLQWTTDFPVQTTGGILVFDSGNSPGSVFTAVVPAAPGAGVLLMGIAVAGVRRRR